jgi:glycine cleavage system regulatory protein
MIGGSRVRLQSLTRRFAAGVTIVNVSLVLTVIGPDRPGIVERLAQTIATHEANWLESRMAHLAGQFAGLLRASVPEDHAEALTQALKRLEASGLKVVIQRAEVGEPAAERRPMRLDLVGSDRPGIVRDISRVLAERGVNVEDLTTECAAAPMSGGLLFKASAELDVPAELSLEELHRTLEGLANDLMVEITLAKP